MDYKEYKEDINLKLQKLDSSLERIFETRDLISGRVINDYRHAYEIQIAFLASMGERGLNFSLYYDYIPNKEQVLSDWKKELKEYIKPKNFMEGIIYCPTAYEKEYIKIGKNVLRDFDFTTLGNQKR